MARGAGFVAAFGTMTLGLIAWIAHLGLVYGLVALACARPDGSLVPGVVRLAIGGITVAALGMTGVLLWRLRGALAVPETGSETGPPFLDWMAAAVAVFGIVAILWNAAPALLMPMCG